MARTRYHEELVRAIPDTCPAFLLAPPPQPEDAFISRERFDEAGYLASNPRRRLPPGTTKSWCAPFQIPVKLFCWLRPLSLRTHSSAGSVLMRDRKSVV